MKVYIHSAFLLLSLFVLASCGSGNKTSAKIEVSHSFSGANFPGGLVIIGSNTNGKKISISLSSETQKTIELDRGSWTFAAMGWDGSSNFTGNKLCGSTTAEIGGDTATVTLSVNAANCVASGNAALGIKNIFFGSCGIFKDYDVSSDTFYPLTAASSDAYCNSANMVRDFVSPYKAYRVFSLNSYQGTVSAGNHGPCTLLNSGTRFQLPTKFMPFFIRTYKDMNDCSLFSAKSQMFTFPSGLENGDPAVFSHHYMATPTADEARLMLPASFTRRGNSPFMDMIPRMLCSGGDCMNEPNVVGGQVYVPFIDWQGGNNLKKRLIKNVNSNSCPANVMENSSLFRVTNCAIEDGDLVAEVRRNILTCQQSAFLSTVLDVVSKNNKIYLMDNNSVKMATVEGEQLVTPGTNGGNLALAVNEAEDLFILRSGGIVSRSLLVGASYGMESTFIGSGAIKIEAAGQYVFVATSGNYISTYDKTNGVLVSQTIPGNIFQDTPKAMVFADGFLYVLSAGTTTTLSRYQVNNAGGLGTRATIFTDPSPLAVDLSYNSADTSIYVLFPTQYISINTVNNLTNQVSLPSPLISPTAGVFHKNRGYFLNGGSLNVGQYNPVSLGFFKVSLPSPCSETINLSAGGSTSTITFDSREDDKVYNLFNDLFDFVGLRKITSNDVLTYFETFKHDDDDEDYSTGGKIGDVQQMLGPQGIGSLFWDYGSCLDLKTAVTSSPITRSIVIKKPNDVKEMTVTVTASALAPIAGVNNEIPLSMCQGSNPSAVSCSTSIYYDFQLAYDVASNDGSKETGKMKLLCGSKIGQYERVEKDGSDNFRFLALYNTQSGGAEFPRYEIYERNDDPSRVEVQVTRVIRNTPLNIFARSLESRIDSSGVNVNVRELHNNGTFFISGRKDRWDNGVSNFLTASQGTMSDSLRDASTLAAVATTLVPNNCMLITNTLVNVPNDSISTPCLTYPTPAGYTNLTFFPALDHTPYDIVDQADLSNGLLRYPSAIFTLPPPSP